MNIKRPIPTEWEGFAAHPQHAPIARPKIRALSTRDHDLICRWAERHKAEPATGEATSSGPATVRVNDGGAGIRFNFPALSRFRPITWDEWFENFETHELVFLYDRDTAGGTPSYRYKLVKMDTLRGGPVLL